MKRIILSISCMCMIINVYTQNVALHSSTGIQYFKGIGGFTDAYNASNSGDTIYLPGGGFTPPAKIEKQLAIYGAGHYPDSTLATSKTYINGNLILDDNADGFYLEGVELTGKIGTDYNESVDNVIIKYCKMTSLDIYGNSTFTNACDNFASICNVITGEIYLSNAQNAALYNCINQGRVNSSQGNYFINNIFTINTATYIISGSNNFCDNNIFINSQTAVFSGTANRINNNIFVNANPGYGTTPITSGNYTGIAQSSIFINQSGFVFDYSHDYNLQSPGTYIGTDNEEVGIYGGVHEYKEGAVPSNPHIQFIDIAPTTTPEGLLNIQIKSAAQDN